MQKTAVHAAVIGSKNHPDARWVYEEVRKVLPDISLGTVYRCLAVLCAEGALKEHHQADGPALYDANTEAHFHVRCVQCGLIQDVPTDRLPAALLDVVQAASGFHVVQEARIEFAGICAACAGRTE